VRALILALAVVCAAVTAHAAEPTQYVTVVRPEANLRKGPGTRYDKVGQVERGDMLQVLSSQEGWYEIVSPDGEPAWVFKRLVKEAAIPLERGHRVVPSGNYANLRARPHKRAHLAGRLERGVELPTARKVGDWYEVTLPDETTAWVYSRVVRLLEPDPVAPLLAQLRANYPGVIRWGAVNEVILQHYHEAELDLVVESSWHFLPEEQRLALLSEAAEGFEAMLRDSPRYRRRYYNRPLVIVSDPSNTRVGTATPKQARLLNE
jgi:SH3-like domain-containing protein